MATPPTPHRRHAGILLHPTSLPGPHGSGDLGPGAFHFVDWLAGWVALDLDESWSVAQRRELVARAVHVHRFRGTRKGLAEHVWLLTGGRVDVADSGGVTVSQRPSGAARQFARARADPHPHRESRSR